eukprot:2727845-Pleurochrysis_carterae.AAC.2
MSRAYDSLTSSLRDGECLLRCSKTSHFRGLSACLPSGQCAWVTLGGSGVCGGGVAIGAGHEGCIVSSAASMRVASRSTRTRTDASRPGRDRAKSLLSNTCEIGVPCKFAEFCGPRFWSSTSGHVQQCRAEK